MKRRDSMQNIDIGGYRSRLAALAREALRADGDLTRCPDAVSRLYDPSEQPGKTIYESISDGELKDILRQAFERLGRNPSQREVYCIYRIYIRLRFGNWPWALQAAGLKPAKEFANPKKKKPYWRLNKKNGGNPNVRHK